ncbi:N-ethylmaleimide reductase [Methylobrevis pamukkalensis]|uniref:N-ethylmaleimide reductase n=1 Tax=Methylobrevis pamukkalensis TaxID=1439726 RepID=A0A1E3H095_9HYPH|nr:N-ethylmaleimide reductase [Methylobrevis pamukkalensis]
MTPANDTGPDSDPQALYGYVASKLGERGIAFLHVVEGATGGPRDIAPFDWKALKAAFGGVYIANNGYDRDTAAAAVTEGTADAVAFGRLFIANPDLVTRFRLNAPLNEPNRDTFYGGGAEGYTDYPALAEAAE